MLPDRARETPLSSVPHAMYSIWICFILCVPAQTSQCVSMVQRQALPVTPMGRQKPKPWEVNNYIIASYHKAGVYLSNSLTRTIFSVLAAPPEALGHVQYPCYDDAPTCSNMDAPVLMYTDSFNASVEFVRRLKSGSKRLLVAGFVRDPLEMVASAYCYHHDGQEWENKLFPVPEIMQMGPEQGTQVSAESLLPLVEWMASVFAHPDKDTLRLELDDQIKSSEGFDLGVSRLLDHFFGTGTDLISKHERFLISQEAKLSDPNRNSDATTFLNTSSQRLQQHHSNTACKEIAHSVLHKSLSPALLARYQASRL
eukprot:Skav203707  [mRNA]  locus=scaffold259:461375:462486:+ [translate_table: standard]